MPELVGTSLDPLRKVGWKGTLVSSYDVREIAEQETSFIQGRLYGAFLEGLKSCAWRMADSYASQGMYHVGIIEARLMGESYPYGGAGWDLFCVCGVRELREKNLSIDELEYYRKQMADRILYELETALSRNIESSVKQFLGLGGAGVNGAGELRLPPKTFLLPAPQPVERPKRVFEIVSREKLEA
jgi:hypothetical protein